MMISISVSVAYPVIESIAANANQILTESGEGLLTEAGENIIQEGTP